MLQDLNIDTAIHQKQPKVISLRQPEVISSKFNRSEI
mgnify:FL=1